MIPSRRGVIGLPIKLTVSFLILALMVPPILSTVENIQDGMDDEKIRSSAEELAEAIDLVGSKGPNYKVFREIDVVEGGCLTVGGDDGYLVRGSFGEETICTILLSRPVLGEEISLFGNILIEISNGPEGVMVKAI